MQKGKSLWIIGLLAVGMLLVFSCQKNGNFIDEDQLGVGIHYYPAILNERYYDTLTHKYFDDTLFSSGQKVIFELKYASQDSVDQIELWAAETGSPQQKLSETAYKPAYYSVLQKCDTTFIHGTLPVLSDSTLHELTLIPKVRTQKGLVTTHPFTIKIK